MIGLPDLDEEVNVMKDRVHLLKTTEVAEYARCHPVTVRRAAAAGELLGMQRKSPQGEWRFRMADVERWLRGE